MMCVGRIISVLHLHSAIQMLGCKTKFCHHFRTHTDMGALSHSDAGKHQEKCERYGNLLFQLVKITELLGKGLF